MGGQNGQGTKVAHGFVSLLVVLLDYGRDPLFEDIFSLNMVLLSCVMSLLIAFHVSTQEISFPPVLNLDSPQQPFGASDINNDDDGIDIITGSQFHGLTTFAHLPYVNCFKDKDVEAYDIVILGAPFDTVSTLSRINFNGQKIISASSLVLRKTWRDGLRAQLIMYRE